MLYGWWGEYVVWLNREELRRRVVRFDPGTPGSHFSSSKGSGPGEERRLLIALWIICSPVCTGLGGLCVWWASSDAFPAPTCRYDVFIVEVAAAAPILQSPRVHDHLPRPVQFLTLADLWPDLNLPRVLLIKLLALLAHLLLLLLGLVLLLAFLFGSSLLNFLL